MIVSEKINFKFIIKLKCDMVCHMDSHVILGTKLNLPTKV
jgi:hypothetical protein